MKELKIAMVGCGNMGSALVENIQKKLKPQGLYIFDIDKGRQESLVRGFGAIASPGIRAAVQESVAVIVAVKPQDIGPVLDELATVPGRSIISIAAGITLGFMEEVLGAGARLVRAMPNLNALIGHSVTALSPNASCGPQALAVAEDIFRCVGEVVRVPESQMDAVTAISGSGPAFVAYLMDALSDEVMERVMREEAQRFGIDAEVARVLAQGTIAGTRLMTSVNFDRDILVKRVSSKGGTTEAGMKVLAQEGKTAASLAHAIRAARRRSEELARRV